MKPILWRLTAASAGVLVALSMNVGPASASSSQHSPRPERGPVQVADQTARTDQHAHSSAKSEQFLPINANVPVQILSLGSNGGKTTQSNNSTAKSNASNQAWTDQSLHQNQVAPKPEGPKPEGPKDHDGGWKPKGPKGHKPEGHKQDCKKPEGSEPGGPKGDGGWKGDGGPKGPEGHGPKAPEGPAPAFQGASQSAHTDQDAHSSAKSEQFLPINANVPVQILSLGSNGGKTTQSNNSTAKSNASNQAWTDQSLHQNQVAPKPEGPKPEGPKDHDGGWNPEGPKGNGGWKGDGGPKGPEGHGPKAPEGPAPAFQGASQQASTHQNADSSATSKQIAPVNANVPVQILSLGSNGGDTTQSNNSTAKSNAANEAGTDQSANQQQQAGPAPAFQGASQQASTHQNADSSATSKQIAPVNANVPVQILSLGSNGGGTTQSNNSTATSSATNQAGTSQVLGQAQGVAGGLLG